MEGHGLPTDGLQQILAIVVHEVHAIQHHDDDLYKVDFIQRDDSDDINWEVLAS